MEALIPNNSDIVGSSFSNFGMTHRMSLIQKKIKQ